MKTTIADLYKMIAWRLVNGQKVYVKTVQALFSGLLCPSCGKILTQDEYVEMCHDLLNDRYIPIIHSQCLECGAEPGDESPIEIAAPFVDCVRAFLEGE